MIVICYLLYTDHSIVKKSDSTNTATLSEFESELNSILLTIGLINRWSAGYVKQKKYVFE